MRLRVGALFLLLVCITGGIVVPEAGGHRLSATVRLDYTGPSASGRQTRRFWTPRRMRRAEPVAPLISSAPVSLATPALARVVGGGEVVPPAFPPDGGSGGARRPSATEPPQYGGFPYSTAGKVFFTDQGHPFVCSGAAVNAQNRSVVWTAGHCLFSEETKTWAQNWLFVPQYRYGAEPKGEWPLYKGWVPHAWTTDFDRGVDSAAVVVEPQQGKTIVDRTGGLGFRSGEAREQNFLALGYPSAEPFDGERMMSCVSPTADSFPTDFGVALGMSCDMTPGSSGGPWIVEGEYLNSNVSFHLTDVAGVQYGPYFGAAARSLLDTAGEYEVPGVTPSPPPPSSPPPPAADTTAPTLSPAYARPNPFSPNGDGHQDKTRISWTLSEMADVSLTIVGPSGAAVYARTTWTLEADDYFVPWNGRNESGRRVRSGLYSFQLEAQDPAGNVASPVIGAVTVRR